MIFKFIFLQIYHLFNKDLHKLEYDAKTQYNFHRIMAVAWVLAGIGVVFVPSLWSHSIGILVVLEVSLYANFATEFGSMSAAEAAMAPGASTNVVTPAALPGTVAPAVKADKES